MIYKWFHTCHGADSKAKDELVSKNGGIFYGFHGTYTPIPYFFDDTSTIGDLWGRKVTSQYDVTLGSLWPVITSLPPELSPSLTVSVQTCLIGGTQKPPHLDKPGIICIWIDKYQPICMNSSPLVIILWGDEPMYQALYSMFLCSIMEVRYHGYQ